jgi:predicted DNA-binding transcriptional regulator AlpA
LIDRGELRRVKLGKKTTFLEADVVAFIDRRVAEAREPTRRGGRG